MDLVRIRVDSFLRLCAIAIRGFFAHTHHSNDGPLESLGIREEVVFQNITYDHRRSEAVRYAREQGVRTRNFSVYQMELRAMLRNIEHPGGRVWLDVVSPNRKKQ